MSRNPTREEALFADALELPPAARAAFLANACGADLALLDHLMDLLAAHGGPASLLASAPLRASEVHDEKPGDMIGRYKLLRKIGEGGCGVVWMAEQEEPVRRRVALKVIKLGMDTKAVLARFDAERQALAMMDYPDIAKVLDGGATAAGRPFFVMELIQGIPITKYCDDNHLTPDERLQLFVRICHAVQHAHQKGIVHRDLKPSNILVTLHEGAPAPKIIDFGIAKATQGPLTNQTLFTAFEQFIGTPAYMSPEQAEMSGLEIDARADIYSLGVLLYELLTGQLPFDLKSFARAGVDEIRHRIREDEPPRPSMRLRTLTDADRTTVARLRRTGPAQLSILLRGDLDWIIMRCLEKDRTRRYATANELALDIQRHLHHEPVVARPPSCVYALRKLIRRNRAGFVAATAIAGVIAVAALIVIRVSGNRSGIQNPPAELPGASSKSIAVLPFVNMSDDKEGTGFFADGMHEDILTNLARIHGFRVISRTSVIAYRGSTRKIGEIARELDVNYILEGSVRRAGNRIRVTGQLIDARTDEHIWANNYDRDLTDVFAIQSEVAREIARSLHTTISPEERTLLDRRPTSNPAAYDLYLKARMFNDGLGNPATRKMRETFLKGAVDLDPKFAIAWAELGSHQVNNRNAPAAKSAIDTALELAPDAPEGIVARGLYILRLERDEVRAGAEFERAARLEPNNPRVLMSLAGLSEQQQRWTEALAHRRKLVSIDPGHILYARHLVSLYVSGRRYDEAIVEQRRVTQLAPGDLREAFFLAWLPFMATGSTKEITALISRLTDEEADSTLGLRIKMRVSAATGDTAELLRLMQNPAAAVAFPTISRSRAFRLDHDDFVFELAAGGDLPPKPEWLAELTTLREAVARTPASFPAWVALAERELLLGDRDEARRCARKALEVAGSRAEYITLAASTLALVAGWTGDIEPAIDEYSRLLQVPRSGLNVHEMRRGARYKPLQGHPRFEALLQDPKNNAPLF